MSNNFGHVSWMKVRMMCIVKQFPMILGSVFENLVPNIFIQLGMSQSSSWLIDMFAKGSESLAFSLAFAPFSGDLRLSLWSNKKALPLHSEGL